MTVVCISLVPPPPTRLKQNGPVGEDKCREMANGVAFIIELCKAVFLSKSVLGHEKLSIFVFLPWRFIC